MAKQKKHASSKGKSTARAKASQKDGQRLGTDGKELQKLNLALAERIKELNCLYGLSRLVEQPKTTLEELLSGLVELIPQGWRYPEITAVRVLLDKHQFRTPNFRKTPWVQSAHIKVHGKKAGAIEVYYLEERPEEDEGPFLKEERDLLNMLAERLAHIADRKRAEEALRQSQQKYKTLSEASPDGIVMADVQTRELKYVNSTACKMLGYGRAELIKMRVDDIHPKDSLEDVISEFTAQANGEKILAHNLPCLRKDGTTVYADVHAVKVSSAARECLLGFFRDLTERKETQVILRDTEELLSFTMKMVSDGISICEYDPVTNKKQLVYCNDRFVEMSGRTREELFKAEDLMEFVVDLASPEAQARGPANIAKADGKPFGNLASWKRPDGKENVYEWSAVSVKRGDKFHLIDADRDVTERLKAEENLRNYRRRLRELASESVLAEERVRRQISRGLHDDVGQDLLSVKMRLAGLRKEVTSAKQADAMDEIEQCIGKVIRNTRTLLFDLSPPVLYDLGFEPAVEWLTEKVQVDHGIVTVFEDDGQDKLLAEDLRIGLFRAVRELLLNTVKHAQAKNVKVSVRKDGPNILVKMEDDGVGFDAEKTQAPGDLSEGFGLFDIRERLRHFGGSFHLQSRPGQGTQITLLAPLK